jgi:hypothetical protein
MEYDRRPVLVGALVQAVVLGGYLASTEGISSLAFALGVVAVMLTETMLQGLFS